MGMSRETIRRKNVTNEVRVVPEAVDEVDIQF